MKRFYSRLTGNCYLENGPLEIPPGAVLISDDRYQEVIANPAPGKVRGHDELGLPILIDPSDTEDIVAQFEALERAWRDGEIAATDWLVSRHREEVDLQKETSLTAQQYGELLSYRQALREWPQAVAFPDEHLRPITPGWIGLYTP